MSTIAERYARIRASLPSHITLVAVSKYHTVAEMMQAYDVGVRDFGESREQELLEKASQMPADVRWHYIGHLQRNKVSKIVPFVHLIQSVDSLRLLQEIDRRAEQAGRRINCLLQVHVAEESTKFGFTTRELIDFAERGEWKSYPHVCLVGLMAMATHTDDTGRVESDFRAAYDVFNAVRTRMGEQQFSTLSMGMSEDYELAIGQGSTMVRIGSAIFSDNQD